MSLNEFNQEELEAQRNQYAKEVEERWGKTDAYRESAKKTAAYTAKDWAAVKAETDAVFSGFAALVGHSPVSPEVRALVVKWRELISSRFYHCSDEMLAGLGEMYLVDERFAKTLNAYGEGTAALMSEAMRRLNEITIAQTQMLASTSPAMTSCTTMSASMNSFTGSRWRGATAAAASRASWVIGILR